jgi:hypothetical protein
VKLFKPSVLPYFVKKRPAFKPAMPAFLVFIAVKKMSLPIIYHIREKSKEEPIIKKTIYHTKKANYYSSKNQDLEFDNLMPKYF